MPRKHSGRGGGDGGLLLPGHGGSSVGQTDDGVPGWLARMRLEAMQELDGCVGEAAFALGKGTGKT